MNAFNKDLIPSDEDRALLPLVVRRLPHEGFKLAQQSFKVVTTPAVPTMREAMAQANWRATGALLIMLLLSSNLVSALFFLASTVFVSTREFAGRWYHLASPGLSVFMIPPLCVLVGIVILYGLARLFGGRGTFLSTLYTTLLFQVPFILLDTICALFPLGQEKGLILTFVLVRLAIQLSCAVFQVLVLRAVHELSPGRAVMSVVLLVILLSPLTLFLSITLF